MTLAPTRVGKQLIQPLDPSLLDLDERGILWVYEDPRPNAIYVIGVDVSQGITGWKRELRTQDDYRTDNTAVEVVRVGIHGAPDTQVAEYAAPIDAYDAAPIVNALGRIFCGSQEDGQALVIIEVYPGPGWATQRELISKFGYSNLYVWRYEDSFVAKRSTKLGWYASKASNRDLFLKCIRHIRRGKFLVHSEALLDEMADATGDYESTSIRAMYGAHDDRLRAAFLSIWAAHEWNLEIDAPESAEVVAAAGPDFQRSDVSYEQMCADADSAIGDGLDRLGDT